MNFLNNYYSQKEGHIVISADQGSQFAKSIANDFNPIHDADSRRFCVPGDLLFAIALQQYDLYEEMQFTFTGLVKMDTQLYFSKSDSEELSVTNDRDKQVLSIHKSGAKTDHEGLIEQLVKNYVAFSGQNFPHILVPLMEEHQVMINPKRPLVIYEKMSLHFEKLDFSKLNIKLDKTNLSVDGKRGDAKLHFVIMDGQETIGSGIKTLVLSGLREYDKSAIDAMCKAYEELVLSLIHI